MTNYTQSEKCEIYDIHSTHDSHDSIAFLYDIFILFVSRNQNYCCVFPPGGENVNKVTNIFC